jgi:hypothetical protein
MPDEHSELCQAPIHPDGSLYREIASGLRELARRCRFRTGRGELVQLATIFEQRAYHFDSRWR